MKRFTLGLIAAFLVLSLGVTAQTNVFDDVIVPSPNHTYLEAAIIQEGLESALQNASADLTVFAPTDAAFDSLAAALNTTIAGLLALPNLTDILTYHVLGTQVPSSAITNGSIVQPLSTTNTLKLTLTSTGDVFVNQAQVTAADITTDNGVVHVLNKIVLPVETVADVAIDNGFTTLTTAVVTAELLPALTDPLATFTVFAPTNQAFDDLASALNSTISGLLALPNLADVLTYHVLGTEVPSSAITNGAIVQPLSATNTLKVTLTSMGMVYVNQAQVTTADISSDNGVVHVLDAVVLPVETVVDVAIDNGFTSLATAVVTAELLPALTNPLAELTVFAPTNQAFDDLAAALNTDINGLLALPNLADVLTYHVLGTEVPSSAITNGAIVQPLSPTNTLKVTLTSMGMVYVNQAQVTTADVGADNGIVHILDAVVLPSETVVDVAIDNGFSTLATAVVTAELLPALTDPLAKYTVFAPTNQAFDDLAAAFGTDLAGVLASPDLANILLYHVVSGENLSTSLTDGMIIPTLYGPSITAGVSTDGVTINSANVTTADVASDNGVVHVIDGVLTPTATSVKEVQQVAFKIYPNPATDMINIESEGNNTIEEAIIYDMSGRIILQTAITNNNMIDVSEIERGAYILGLRSENGVSMQKLQIL